MNIFYGRLNITKIVSNIIQSGVYCQTLPEKRITPKIWCANPFHTLFNQDPDFPKLSTHYRKPLQLIRNSKIYWPERLELWLLSCITNHVMHVISSNTSSHTLYHVHHATVYTINHHHEFLWVTFIEQPSWCTILGTSAYDYRHTWLYSACYVGYNFFK